MLETDPSPLGLGENGDSGPGEGEDGPCRSGNEEGTSAILAR